jgi:GNAT superfamily N-acetyltransferase
MIRPIEERDYPRFAELAAQLGYPIDAAFVTAQLKKEALAGDSATFVYEEKGEVVGWVGCRIQERAYRRPYGECSGLVIDGAHRGRGYGAELLAVAEEWFREKKMPEILIRSNTKRTDAHRFYDREGYQTSKTQTVFTKELDS